MYCHPDYDLKLYFNKSEPSLFYKPVPTEKCFTINISVSLLTVRKVKYKEKRKGIISVRNYFFCNNEI